MNSQRKISMISLPRWCSGSGVTTLMRSRVRFTCPTKCSHNLLIFVLDFGFLLILCMYSQVNIYLNTSVIQLSVVLALIVQALLSLKLDTVVYV